MQIIVGISFFIFPLLLLLEVIAIQFMPSEEEDTNGATTVTTNEGSSSRLLADSEDQSTPKEAFLIVNIWIFASLTTEIIFSSVGLMSLMNKLRQ